MAINTGVEKMNYQMPLVRVNVGIQTIQEHVLDTNAGKQQS